MNEDINISLHTMALARGGRIGAIMYYVKTYYAFEILGNKEFWATYESYNGWHRWGLGMAQPSYPWPEYQHELGGARVYYVTKKYWDASIKDYVQPNGRRRAELRRPDRDRQGERAADHPPRRDRVTVPTTSPPGPKEHTASGRDD